MITYMIQDILQRYVTWIAKYQTVDSSAQVGYIYTYDQLQFSCNLEYDRATIFFRQRNRKYLSEKND